METPTIYLASTDQALQFTSLEGKKPVLHNIVGWAIVDGKASPVLFPEPRLDAVLLYQNGSGQKVTELMTGQTFQSIEKAIEAQP